MWSRLLEVNSAGCSSAGRDDLEMESLGWKRGSCPILAVAPGSWGKVGRGIYKRQCLVCRCPSSQLGSFFFFFSWRLITLQYCSGFCNTLTWISQGFTCIPHPDPPSTRCLGVFPVYQLDSCWMSWDTCYGSVIGTLVSGAAWNLLNPLDDKEVVEPPACV